MELHTPDGAAGQDIVVVGSSSAAESSPTYVMATECGLNEPASTSGPEIRQPQMHWVLKVTGTHAL